VLLAVLAGALFLDRSQRLVPVYAAARDLPAGTSLEDGDLVVIRARLPATALRHYLRPSIDRQVSGRILTAPVRRETLIPAELVLASSRDADLGELPVRVDPGGMAQGLRPGDSVQVLAAYTEGARRGRAVVLLPSAEVIQVFQDPAGITGAGQDRGVQLRMPSDRASIVAAAIATARIFVVKTRGSASDDGAAAPPTPGGAGAPVPGTDASQPDTQQTDVSGPDASGPDVSGPDASGPGVWGPDASQPDTSTPGPGAPEPGGSLSGGGQPTPTSSSSDAGDTQLTATRPPTRSVR
jgi:hypothetical protein